MTLAPPVTPRTEQGSPLVADIAVTVLTPQYGMEKGSVAQAARAALHAIVSMSAGTIGLSFIEVSCQIPEMPASIPQCGCQPSSFQAYGESGTSVCLI